MSNKSFVNYVAQDSWVHELKGSTKLIAFILLSLTAMISYDTRLLLVIVVMSLIIFKISKVPMSRVKTIFLFIFGFLILNVLMIYLFSPEEGVKIYGSRTVLWEGFGRYTITAEQLFYLLNVMLKYFAVAPLSVLFIVATYPSEFAASLNKIGVSYRIAYSVSIALRYIPTIQEDFVTIFQAQQARGVDMSKKQSFIKRIRNVSYTLFPLIFSSMNKIDIISNAMLLRGFGKSKTRTWYHDRPTERNDYITIVVSIGFVVVSILLFIVNNGRFYSPF